MKHVENELVSIYCIMYNQEKYVSESINGLLSQTYSPLEIVFSDDCSTDGTYDKAKSIIDAYTGPHKITLIKNSDNLGIVKNVERCMSMVHGEWIFQAAGDDISHPNRVEMTMKYWMTQSPQSKAIFTNLDKINDSNHELGFYFKEEPIFARTMGDLRLGIECWAIGASLAYHRSLIDKYGGFVANVIMEDGCIAFRALLEGGLTYYHKPTVKYRFHSNNASQNIDLDRKIKFLINKESLFYNYLKDSLIGGVDKSVLRRFEMFLVKSRILNFILKMRFLVKILYHGRAFVRNNLFK